MSIFYKTGLMNIINVGDSIERWDHLKCLYKIEIMCYTNYLLATFIIFKVQYNLINVLINYDKL
jgi:hypothetical protein